MPKKLIFLLPCTFWLVSGPMYLLTNWLCADCHELSNDVCRWGHSKLLPKKDCRCHRHIAASSENLPQTCCCLNKVCRPRIGLLHHLSQLHLAVVMDKTLKWLRSHLKHSLTHSILRGHFWHSNWLFQLSIKCIFHTFKCCFDCSCRTRCEFYVEIMLSSWKLKYKHENLWKINKKLFWSQDEMG